MVVMGMEATNSETVDIIIPTCKGREEVAPLVKEIELSTAGRANVIATCLNASAAVNRNCGLDQAKGDVVFMIDDDVYNFQAEWDLMMSQVLRESPGSLMVSARLMNTAGELGVMLGFPASMGEVVEVPRQELPTACIVIWNDGTRFDEGFIGSGWEDTDFCARLRGIHPEGKFLVCNNVKVVHLNEMKEQHVHLDVNAARYVGKWGMPR